MVQTFINFFSQFPHGLAVYFMAMIPVGELRLALPVAILGYHMPVWEAFLFGVLGNLTPTTIILVFASRFHTWLEKNSGFWSRHWIKHLAKIQKRFEKYQKYELWGIMIFIACSLPGTGSYTGALAAFIFGIPLQKSWPYVFAGVAISGILTLLVIVGVDKVF